MAINFPNNPAVNDTFTVGGTTFTFTGVKWETSAVVEISSDTTPSLGGTLDAGTHNINNVGVITATTFSGNLIGNVTGTATTATYAQTAGIATNAQGLTGDPSIQVTNATVLGNLDVQGTTTTIDTAITEVDSLNVEGSVGIGTTNPLNLLDILQNNGRTRVTSFGHIITQNHNHGTTNYWSLAPRNSGELNIAYGSADGNGTVATNKLTINSNGQVKISGEDDQDNFIVDAASGTEFAIHQDATDGEISIRAQDGTGNNYAKYMTFFTEGGSGPTERLRITSAGNVTATGTISDSKGGLRDIPLNDESTNASYTLVASDAGKVVHVHSTTTTVVVPNSVFSVGNVVTILNGGTSNIAVTQGSGFALRNTADGSSGSRTLAQFGMATIYFTGAGVGYISGSNMT